jgi:hypothetical protein
MSSTRATTTAIKVHRDGSITFPPADVEIIKSALLWAFLPAQEMSKTAEQLADADFLSAEARAIHAKNANYHTERAAKIANLEECISAAMLTARENHRDRA